MTLLQLILSALSGSLAAQLLEFYEDTRLTRVFNFPWALGVVLLSTFWTILYFSYFNPAFGAGITLLLVAHYAVFVSLAVETVKDTLTQGRPRPQIGYASAIPTLPTSSALVLNGFLPVFGVGTFGAFLAELLVLYKTRTHKQRHFSKFYWWITGGMILAGGGLAALYGITNVSAPLAAQIGASAPLIISRLK